jgi:hypothetical protein
MSVGNNNEVTPTSTALQARVLLYQPSQRPRHREGDWIETSFGRCRVTGRLGQRHADVIEAILYCAERMRTVSDGGVELLVDPARVRKTLSNSQYSHQRMWSLLREAMSAVIEIEAPNLKALGHLIDQVVESPMTRPDPLTGGERNLWRVRLGASLVMLLENDLKLYYDPAPIARLQHGISQAVARHILSHKREPAGGWHIDTVVVAVAGALQSKPMRDARFRLKADADELKTIGLILEGERIRKHPGGKGQASHSRPKA